MVLLAGQESKLGHLLAVMNRLLGAHPSPRYSGLVPVFRPSPEEDASITVFVSESLKGDVLPKPPSRQDSKEVGGFQLSEVEMVFLFPVTLPEHLVR